MWHCAPYKRDSRTSVAGLRDCRVDDLNMGTTAGAD